MHKRTERGKSSRRNLFVKIEQVSEFKKRTSEPSRNESKRRPSGSCSVFGPDPSFAKNSDDEDALLNIETYLSSDDGFDANETNIRSSSPEITEFSGSESIEELPSPILQPVDHYEDDEPTFLVASDDSCQSLNTSDCCISDQSSPDKNVTITCQSPVISCSPFRSPNVQKKYNSTSPSQEISESPFKSPNNIKKISSTSPSHDISESPFKSPNNIKKTSSTSPSHDISESPFKSPNCIKKISSTIPSPTISESPFKSPNIKREDNETKESKSRTRLFKTPDKISTSKPKDFSSDQKRKKFIAGGFAEQFEKFCSKEKNDQAIWKHQRHRISTDNNTMTLRVISLRKQYSVTFVFCKNLNESNSYAVTSSFIELLKLESGNIIKLHFPWTKLELDEIGSSVICANFVEIIDRCSMQFPKISRCVYEWSCLCTNDASVDPQNCSCLSRRQTTEIDVKSRHNPLDTILDIVENTDFFITAYVQRVFHYFIEHSKVKTWSLLLQDKSEIFSVLNLKFVDSKLLPLIQNAEGKLFYLGQLQLLQKTHENRSIKLFSVIHTLQNRSSIKYNSYQQFCFILKTNSENFTMEEENNSPIYIPPEVKSIVSILQDISEGHRGSSIIKVVFVHEDKLFVTDDSCVSKTGHNYVVVLQTTEVIQCSNLEIGCILYLKDFQFTQGKFLLDKYSRVYCLTCQNDLDSNLHINFDSNKIEKLSQFSPILQNFTSELQNQELVTISGTILKPDEEMSFSWPVCSDCDNQILCEIKNGVVFCNKCNRIVQNPIIKMQLEVYITSQSFPPNSTVKVRLMNRTIENLLPRISDDGSYDIECILNKQIGPLDCYIEQVYPVDDSDLQMIVLREV